MHAVFVITVSHKIHKMQDLLVQLIIQRIQDQLLQVLIQRIQEQRLQVLIQRILDLLRFLIQRIEHLVQVVNVIQFTGMHLVKIFKSIAFFSTFRIYTSQDL